MAAYNGRPMILAADVGGTKTLVGLFIAERGRLRSVRERVYASQESSSLEAILRGFLADHKKVKVTRCSVGVAGPVVRGRSQVVNLRWPVDGRRLAKALRLRRIHVLNDLEATGWGIGQLTPRQLVNLTPGLRGEPGNAALIAAGTGLGMALLFWDGRCHHPSASEGGHQGFPPRDDLEVELLRFLARRHGRVSLERVVAGPAFRAIFDFLVETGRGTVSPDLERRMRSEDPNAVVSSAGVTGEDKTAERAVDLFVSLYGAAAGDLALVARATAGVFVGGGIAPRILPKLRGGAFLDAFRAKGRLRPLVEKIPVRVILEPRTALLGAAACAAASPA